MTRALLFCLVASVAFGQSTGTTLSVPVDRLRDAIADTAFLTAQRSERGPLFNSTEFRVSNKGLRLVSTDGWSIAVFNLSVSNALATPTEAVLDNDFLRWLHPRLRGSAPVNISFAPGEVTFLAGADKHSTQPLTQPFPDWAKEVAGLQPFTVAFKRQEFVQVLQGIPGEVVGLKIADNAITFRTKTGSTIGAIRTSAPVRHELQTSINPKFLLNFGTLAEGESLELAYSEAASRAIRLRVERDDRFVYYLLPKLFN